ncbi:transforming growth factor-beta-induced protein ig-h3-like [Dreissena polymorpha]|uniref:transforming growth factor-beta-induced protein ig-h3-like n=1 Tax=Dreissena polymorpha TaxID=45954 RepID=UPI0022641DF4|nr:transforming growth factor-beta-induced protein ig-h3-like [Dreissena polymorpha]
MMRLLVLSAFLVFAYAATIPELATQLGATELVRLVTQAGLADTLSSKGPFTVFAPTNDAFAKLPKAILDELMRNKQLLIEVLKYHVVSGSVYSSQLTDGMTSSSLAPLSEGKFADICFNIYNNGNLVTAEGSPVVLANQNASNGVIHVVNRVLFPLPVLDIPSFLSSEKERFSTLLTAIEKANLVTILSEGAYTVFAPTDEAFAKIPPDVLNKLLANATALLDVVAYHVLSRTFWSASLSDGMTFRTELGKSVRISINSGKVSVNSANVQEADVSVTNGVIHVIDTVLMPPTLDINSS